MKFVAQITDLGLDRLPVVKPQQVYAVGGCVRDLLLGMHPQDYDLAVANDPEDFARRSAAAIQGRLVILGRRGHRTYRIVAATFGVDIAPIAGAAIEEDLRRRDFTVNAMGCDLATGELIDCTGGRADLRRGVIRMVSATAFRRDPLRMIRAYRLAGRFGWGLEPATTAAVASQKKRIQTVAGERIWDELQKILALPASEPVLEQMAATGLLMEVLPELQTPRKTGIADDSRVRPVLSACLHLEHILAKPAELAPNPEFFPRFGSTAIPTALAKLALLLAPIEKAAEPRSDWAGDPARRAADSALRACRRLRTSMRQAEYVAMILRNGRRPLQLHRQNADRRERVRFLLGCHPRVADILLHAAAVQFVADPDEYRSFIRFARGLLDEYYRRVRPRIEAPPLVTGRDLIETFHLEPSPHLGEILEELQEAHLADEIRDRPDALHWLRARFGRRKSTD